MIAFEKVKKWHTGLIGQQNLPLNVDPEYCFSVLGNFRFFCYWKSINISIKNNYIMEDI